MGDVTSLLLLLPLPLLRHCHCYFSTFISTASASQHRLLWKLCVSLSLSSHVLHPPPSVLSPHPPHTQIYTHTCIHTNIHTHTHTPIGTMRLESILAAVRSENVHFPVTQLVCLEVSACECVAGWLAGWLGVCVQPLCRSIAPAYIFDIQILYPVSPNILTHRVSI